MAFGLEDFDIPANLHIRNAPPGFFLHRTNRRNFLLWLACYMGLPHPSENTAPWYALTYDKIVQPITGHRPFANNMMNWHRVNPDLVRHFTLVIMDAFPEVDWELWRFEGRYNPNRGNMFEAGYVLPHPDVETITATSPVVVTTGRDVSRTFITIIAERLGIANDDWETGWNNRTWTEIYNLEPEIPKVEVFRGANGNSLFQALSTHFDDVDFIWRPWLVGGNVPVGFGNRAIVDDEQAREDLQALLCWYVQHEFHVDLDEVGIDILYDVGQRGIERWTGTCKNHFKGSPQEMIEFAFPNHDWDPTLFGQNRERQRRIYHMVRSRLNSVELALMNEQPNQGWEHNFTPTFGLFPLTSLLNGHEFGGDHRSTISGDVFVDPRHAFVDVLGEDHTDIELRRSNARSDQNRIDRFHQRWIQDRQRWDRCWRDGQHIIAVGPFLSFSDEENAAFFAAVDATQAPGPSFIAFGFPEDYTFPTFGENGIIDFTPLSSNTLQTGGDNAAGHPLLQNEPQSGISSEVLVSGEGDGNMAQTTTQNLNQSPTENDTSFTAASEGGA